MSEEEEEEAFGTEYWSGKYGREVAGSAVKPRIKVLIILSVLWMLLPVVYCSFRRRGNALLTAATCDESTGRRTRARCALLNGRYDVVLLTVKYKTGEEEYWGHACPEGFRNPMRQRARTNKYSYNIRSDPGLE